jgi:RNA polymerase sporulation-specific sigma factor
MPSGTMTNAFKGRGGRVTSDAALALRARGGDELAAQRLVERYRGFVRLKASSYFLLGGESDDLIQEGLVGLYKAIRDYRTDRESSFRNFAELCITRQIITAVKTATRNKHTPLNQYVSFSQTPARGSEETTLAEVIPGPEKDEPVLEVLNRESLIDFISALDSLSELERNVADLLADGCSYEEAAVVLDITTKAVDNAVTRVRRKLASRLLTNEEKEWKASRPPLIDSIRDYVAAHPGRTGAEIARGVGTVPSSVYYQLGKLGDAFESRPDGRTRRYYLVGRGEEEPTAA